jgi:hypothetical protein
MQVGSMTEGGGEVGVSTVIQGARKLGTIDGNNLLNTLGVFPADLPPRRLSQVVAKGNVSRLLVIVRMGTARRSRMCPSRTCRRSCGPSISTCALPPRRCPPSPPTEIRARDLLGLRDHVPHALHTSSPVGGMTKLVSDGVEPCIRFCTCAKGDKRKSVIKSYGRPIFS